MIENGRTGLLWNLFMSSPEVKSGLKKPGFDNPSDTLTVLYPRKNKYHFNKYTNLRYEKSGNDMVYNNFYNNGGAYATA